MAGMVNPVLTLTRDRATKTVRAVATCRINFNEFELRAMQQGTLQFRLRAKLFGADSSLPNVDGDLFTFTPAKFYPDATPNAVEDATFEETLAEELLDEDYLGTDEVVTTFELMNQPGSKVLRRNSPQVSGRA
jgi:hypothetical protein